MGVIYRGDIPYGGGGGDAKLENALTASVAVGGVKVNDTFAADTPLETVVRSILSPTLYPTFTNPSASMTASGAKLIEKGGSLASTFTISFNRGSINPAYGTSGYRSGAATSYTLDGTTQATNTFSITVTEAKTSYQGSVAYAQGEQPKDSNGGNYSTPLPAGSVNTNTITYEFVYATFSNQSNINTVAKDSLVSMSAKTKTFNFPAQSVAHPEEFHVPSSWNITAVEMLNTLNNQWEDCSSEFTTGTTTHQDAGGNTVNYVTYTDNRGYSAGDRKVRIKWS